ncbi:MAG: hypothetical protein BWY83_02870 [bacterium ADurb.Bin478]|nr:MAG: hypothetical protein BWY83_02870 [bacterium ADurb.Bin478]
MKHKPDGPVARMVLAGIRGISQRRAAETDFFNTLVPEHLHRLQNQEIHHIFRFGAAAHQIQTASPSVRIGVPCRKSREPSLRSLYPDGAFFPYIGQTERAQIKSHFSAVFLLEPFPGKFLELFLQRKIKRCSAAVPSRMESVFPCFIAGCPQILKAGSVQFEIRQSLPGLFSDPDQLESGPLVNVAIGMVKTVENRFPVTPPAEPDESVHQLLPVFRTANRIGQHDSHVPPKRVGNHSFDIRMKIVMLVGKQSEHRHRIFRIGFNQPFHVFKIRPAVRMPPENHRPQNHQK